jgi:serine/threonine protein kinase
MGEVYRARDLRIGRDVAIKVRPALWSHDRDRLRRFEQEARAAGALSHPALLTIHDVGEHDGTPYLVSELLEGETLRMRLHGGPLSPRRAIEYAIQIAHGLAVAHDKGINPPRHQAGESFHYQRRAGKDPRLRSGQIATAERGRLAGANDGASHRAGSGDGDGRVHVA